MSATRPPPRRYPMCRRPGRIRRQLAAILRRDLEIDITAYDLWTQQGAYRHVTWDLARWGGTCHRWTGSCWVQLTVCSWDTMTDIVRAGSARPLSDEGYGPDGEVVAWEADEQTASASPREVQP